MLHLRVSMKGMIYPFLVGLFVVGTSSCTHKQPKFTAHFFPVRYDVKEIAPIQQHKNISLRQIRVNENEDKISQLAEFWQSGVYQTVYRQLHPVSLVSNSDIEQVVFHLRNSFDVFYIELLPGQKPLKDELNKAIGCRPLSNKEIIFMLNFGNNRFFAEKNFSLLLIFAHELLQQIGVRAITPRIVSSVLRERLNLPKLPEPEKINIVAWENIDSDYFSKVSPQGFVFCRKLKL